MKMRNVLSAALAVLCLQPFGSARAQELPQLQFKAIGLNSPTVASIVDEVPFWRETIPRASNATCTAFASAPGVETVLSGSHCTPSKKAA